MYFERLDTIRWYAVFAVVIAHILQVWTWNIHTFFLLPLGNTGVIVFFVLSGFLITRLLLTEPQENALSKSFKNFYLRRTLRIFPIYYLYLAVVFTFGIGEVDAGDKYSISVQDGGAYPWLYLTNIYIFVNDKWLDLNSPLWSLSVEEQFYIFWPFLVLFLRNKTRVLYALFGGIILLAMLTRIYLFANDYSASPQIEVFTLACLDFLAVGSLLSLLYLRHGELLKRFTIPLLVGSLAVYYVSYLLKVQYDLGWIFWSFGKLAVAVAGAAVVIYALHAPAKNGFFHNPITMHLGKISYGIYLYHNAIVSHYADIAKFIGINPGDSLAVKFILVWTFTLIVTELSFAIIEKPLLKLKSRFR